MDSREAIRMRADAYLGGQTLARGGRADRAVVWRPLEGIRAVERSRAHRPAARRARLCARRRCARAWPVQARNSPPKWRKARIAGSFEVATAPLAATTAEFRDLVRQIAAIDTLEGFLRDLRARFPEAGSFAGPSPRPDLPPPRLKAHAPDAAQTASSGRVSGRRGNPVIRPNRRWQDRALAKPYRFYSVRRCPYKTKARPRSRSGPSPSVPPWCGEFDDRIGDRLGVEILAQLARTRRRCPDASRSAVNDLARIGFRFGAVQAELLGGPQAEQLVAPRMGLETQFPRHARTCARSLLRACRRWSSSSPLRRCSGCSSCGSVALHNGHAAVKATCGQCRNTARCENGNDGALCELCSASRLS